MKSTQQIIKDVTEQQSREIFQAWAKNRLQQYADRTGVSIQKAILHLVNLPSFEEAMAEVDKLVDPEYHSTQEPK